MQDFYRVRSHFTHISWSGILDYGEIIRGQQMRFICLFHKRQQPSFSQRGEKTRSMWVSGTYETLAPDAGHKFLYLILDKFATFRSGPNFIKCVDSSAYPEQIIEINSYCAMFLIGSAITSTINYYLPNTRKSCWFQMDHWSNLEHQIAHF